jgi:hypothetical protein
MRVSQFDPLLPFVVWKSGPSRTLLYGPEADAGTSPFMTRRVLLLSQVSGLCIQTTTALDGQPYALTDGMIVAAYLT